MRDKAKKSSGGGSPHERNRPAPTPKAKRKAKPKGGVAHVKTVSKPKAVVAPTPKPKPKVVTTPAPAAKIVAVPKPKVVIAPKPKVEPKVEPKAKATPSPTAVKPGTGSAAAIKPKVEVKPKPVVQPKPEPKAEPINHPAQKEVAVIKPAPKPAPAPVPKVEVAPKPKAKPKGGKPHVLASAPATPKQKVEMNFLEKGLPKAEPKVEVKPTPVAKPIEKKAPVIDSGMDNREKVYEAPAKSKTTAKADLFIDRQKADMGMDDREKAYVKPAAPKPAPTPAPRIKVESTKKGGKPMNEQKLITKGNNVTHDAKKAAEKRAPAPTEYNQAYWADQRAKGVSQADMKVEQDKVGMKKAYSGDTIVTEDMQRKASDDLSRVTGSMATLQNKGVTKTEEKSGLLGENLKTTYDYKGGPSIVTKANDPTIGGVRLGEKTSTTFVDGIEVATKTGHDPLGKDAKVTKPDIAGHINDTQKVDPTTVKDDIISIDEEIKNETDPDKLKALHQRRLRLMRMMRTNTRFAGLLDDADTKRTNLMSIG